MIVLAVDTCLGACSAVLAEDGAVLAQASEPMLRGHQERLAPMVAEVMGTAGAGFGDLTRIAATVGPGSFTGLRVGLSFAKAMALALDIPCVGVGSLDALAHGQAGLALAIADARRGQAYWRAFQDGHALTPPAASSVEDIAAWLAVRPALAIGPGAGLLAHLPDVRIDPRAAPIPAAIARLAAEADPAQRPAPLYLRTPDAKLPGGVEPQW